MAACMNPDRGRHEITPGDRRISLVRVDWGDQDLRDTWQGEYEFCSFKCMADWAAAKADQHDRHILREGA